jgi:hypothetical protein
MSEVLKFPDRIRRRSNDGTSEAPASRKNRTVTKMPSPRVPVMTGDQWREFIRLLAPDERQAFMTDV